jgi:hypothetical protein
MILRGQPCSATRHVGRKSAKELLSLVPCSHVLFCRPSKYAHRPKCHDTDGQARLYPGTRRLSGLWLAVTSHHQKFHLFSFLERYGSLHQLHAKDYQSSQSCSARQGGQTQREKITISDCIWTLQKNLFIFLGFPYLHNSKEK